MVLLILKDILGSFLEFCEFSGASVTINSDMNFLIRCQVHFPSWM